MRRVTRSVTGVGTSTVVPMDINQDPFNIGVGCVLTGTATYSVEHTFDDIYDSTVTPTWFANSGISAQTASKDGNYAFPVAGIRLNVTAGTGTVVMTLLQATQTR